MCCRGPGSVRRPSSPAPRTAPAIPAKATPTSGPLSARPLPRSANRHFPRRALSADRPTPRQAQGARRHRAVDPGHRLAPARRPCRPLPRSRPRLVRQPDRQGPQDPQSHPPDRGPRLHRHPRPGRLTTAGNPAPLRYAGCSRAPAGAIFRSDNLGKLFPRPSGLDRAAAGQLAAPNETVAMSRPWLDLGGNQVTARVSGNGRL